MTESSNQWLLFGFDTRHIAQHWVSAWRDFLFAADAPLRRRLDEPVRLSRDDGQVHIYQGGQLNPEQRASVAADCQASLLPDALALTRSLRLPLGAEAELPAVVAMEIRAHSPFAESDTASGWRESSRDEQGIEIELAIASRAAVRGWLDAQALPTSQPEPEVWVNAGRSMVVLQGFGEARREGVYRRRLAHCALLAAALAGVILCLALLFMLQQRQLLQHRQEQFAALQARAASVIEARSRMADANDLAARADELAAGHPSPHCELLRLTRLLDDQAYIQSLRMRGRELHLRGHAEDAAAVMQNMAEAPYYESVTAPQPIRPAGAGRELFYLDLALRPDAPGSCA